MTQNDRLEKFIMDGKMELRRILNEIKSKNDELKEKQDNMKLKE